MIYNIEDTAEDLYTINYLNYPQYYFYLENRAGDKGDLVDALILGQALAEFSADYDGFEFLEAKNPGNFRLNFISRDNDTPDLIISIKGAGPHYDIKKPHRQGYTEIKKHYTNTGEDLPF